MVGMLAGAGGRVGRAIAYVVGNPADKSSRVVRVAKVCGGVLLVGTVSVGGVLLVGVAVQSAIIWALCSLIPKWK